MKRLTNDTQRDRIEIDGGAYGFGIGWLDTFSLREIIAEIAECITSANDDAEWAGRIRRGEIASRAGADFFYGTTGPAHIHDARHHLRYLAEHVATLFNVD